MLEIKKLLLKPPLLPVKDSSETTMLKSPTLETPLLTFKLRLKVFKTPVTDSEEMPTLLKLILKELELIFQLLKLKTENFKMILTISRTELLINNPNSLKMT